MSLERAYLSLVGAILTVLVAAVGLAPSVIRAQAPGTPASSGYRPSLGDIMGATQLRHFKLWFAGELMNWDLARYELDQITASFSDAGTLYPGIPLSDMTIMAGPVKELGEAIEAKDSAKFTKAFTDMTMACNACHKSIGRAFIVIRIPTASPFSNQSFAPAMSK